MPSTTSAETLARPLATRWIESTISSPPMPLTRYPTAPARNISRTVARSSNADRAITRVRGDERTISRAARGPPPAGMLTSISATSGCSRLASDTASSASEAEPTRASEGSWARRSVRASRRSGSSSATSTRTCALTPRGRGALTRGDASIPASRGAGSEGRSRGAGGRDGRRRLDDGRPPARSLRGRARRAPTGRRSASSRPPRETTRRRRRFFDAFPADRFDASILWLFNREVADLEAFLGAQDIVYVGGGNTVSMLAVWRAHGVDAALRAAYAAGVVMAGISAGANCWFEACTTDSFQLGRADPLRDGLGFVAGSFTPHYDAEPARRPAAARAVGLGWVARGLRVRRVRRRPPGRRRAPGGGRVASRCARVPGGRGGWRDARDPVGRAAARLRGNR